MVLSLIERYVFKKTMTYVLTAAAALIGVVWIARAVQQVDVVMNKGQSIYAYLMMTTLGVPTITAAIAPVALLIGLLQTLNTLNNDSELVVMNAAGTSRNALLKPFMTMGLLTAFLVLFLSVWGGPKSMQTLSFYVNAMRADLVSLVVREGAFRDVGKKMTFHVASRAPGGVLKGLFILDSRNGKETFTYLAEEGALSKIEGETYLILKNGQIQRLPADSDNVSIVKFDSYAFDLSSYAEDTRKILARRAETSTYDLLFAEATDPKIRKYQAFYSVELARRFASPLYPIATVLIIVAMLGFPYSNRQGRWFDATMAALAVIGLRGAGIVVEGTALKQPMLLDFIVLLPLAGVILPALYIWMDRIGGPLRFFRKRFETFLFWLESQYAKFRQKRLTRRLSKAFNRRAAP